MADTLISGTTIIEDTRKGKGEIWSCTGNGFISVDSTSVYSLAGDAGGALKAGSDNDYYVKDIHLPNGVTITTAVVYGSGATWALKRAIINSQNDVDSAVLAGANLGTEDETVLSGIVDNEHYKYYFFVANNDDTFDTNDEINGARIKYAY